MRLDQLRSDLAKVVSRMETLSQAEKMTDEEKKEFNDAKARSKELNEQINNIVDTIEARNRVNALGETKEPAIQVTREHNHNADGEYRGFKYFGEQLRAIVQAGTPNAKVDARLEECQRSIRAASGASESVDADGGFLVQTDFQAELGKKTHDQSQIASQCETVTISSNSNALEWNEVTEDSRATGSRNGGVRVFRDKEAGTVTASRQAYERRKIVAEKQTAIYYATEEILEDAAALQTLVEPAFTEEMAFILDNEIVRGSGVGECLGILNSPALIQVAKESGQTAATIVHANIRKLRARIWTPSKARGSFFHNAEVAPELETLSFTPAGGTSLPVYMPANGISEQPYGRMYGRPCMEIEQADALGEVGDFFFGDFSQYRLVQKGGIKGAASQHVRFIYGEMTFRWTRRINGAPRWRLPLTPFKGSSTVSPFVAIAKR